MSKFISIYTTWPDEKSAKFAAEQFVQKKIVACANVFPKVTSIYNWNDGLQEDSEVVMILKTQKTLFTKTEETIQALHPYEVPCIFALPGEEVHEPYGKWLEDQILG